MKLTNRKLKQIIKEEVQKVLKEANKPTQGWGSGITCLGSPDLNQTDPRRRARAGQAAKALGYQSADDLAETVSAKHDGQKCIQFGGPPPIHWSIGDFADAQRGEARSSRAVRPKQSPVSPPRHATET